MVRPGQVGAAWKGSGSDERAVRHFPLGQVARRLQVALYAVVPVGKGLDLALDAGPA